MYILLELFFCLEVPGKKYRRENVNFEPKKFTVDPKEQVGRKQVLNTQVITARQEHAKQPYERKELTSGIIKSLSIFNCEIENLSFPVGHGTCNSFPLKLLRYCNMTNMLKSV